MPRISDGSNRRRTTARKRTMRIGTWNVQSLNNKFDEVLEELNKINMDIVALTETKKKGSGTEEKHNYIHIYSGVPKEERARRGVSMVIHKKYKRCIKSWEHISERIIQVTMKLMSHEVVVIGVYAPNDDAIASVKDEFYEKMTRLLDSISNRKEIILLGDLNGRVGNKIDDPIVGRFGEDIVNNNGERLIEFCQQNNLRIKNGWFEHKDIHKYTWTQPTRQLKSIIDYVILKQESNLFTTDVRVRRGAECGSDHHLLESRIYFSFMHQTSTPSIKADEGSACPDNVRYNLQSLENDSSKFLYRLRLAQKLSSIRESSAQEMYEEVKACIHQAAKEALGEIEQVNSRTTLPKWWTHDIALKLQRKKEAYMKWLATKTTEDRITYCRYRKEAQQAVNKAKNDLWQNIGSEINKCIGNTRANKAWTVLKSLRTQNKDKSSINLIDMDTWCTYYKQLLTESRPEFIEDTENISYINHQRTVPEISVNEVLNALHSMKNGKAPGPGNVSIELIKSGPEQLIELVTCIFNKCLLNGVVPDDWKKAHITSLFKKGNRQECKNYRGLSVISSIARLYGRVLKVRIEEDSHDAEDQNGFRAGRSCVDGIFVLRQLIEKLTARKQPIHLTFVDLHKAYDTVPLSKLWTSMINMGVHRTYVNAIRNLYVGCFSSIKLGNRLSPEFSVSKGLRQGCTLAPTLFKIYLEEALKSWRRKCSNMGINVGGESLYTLLFADDQVLIAADEDDSSYMVRKLHEEYQKWGLEINLQKTEYLVIGEKGQDLSIDNATIKYCRSFKYLGVILSDTGRSVDDINNKIGQGKRAIKQLNPVLWNDKITKRTKTTIYRTIVESICTYGSETWEITSRNKLRLNAVEMDFWRRSCGISKLEHVRNETIREMMNVESSMVETIEKKQLLWLGHLQRMPNNRWPKRIWDWTPETRRRPGRPARSWRQGVWEAMEARGLQEGDWNNRIAWRKGSEKRRQP